MRTLATAALLVALVSCSGADDAGGSGESEGQSGTSTGLPSQDRLDTYFGAVASYDPERLAQAQDVAADGSPAERYAAFLAQFATAAVAGGQPIPPAESKQVDGGYRACGGSGSAEDCVTWADLGGVDGELVDFTVSGTAIEEFLVDLTGQQPIEVAGLYAVQPSYAYHSFQGSGEGRSLYVLATVAASEVPLEVGPGTYIEQDVILDTVPSLGPTDVPAGSSTPVILAFADADEVALDGQVTFSLRADGRTEESVGFGLTALTG